MKRLRRNIPGRHGRKHLKKKKKKKKSKKKKNDKKKNKETKARPRGELGSKARVRIKKLKRRVTSTGRDPSTGNPNKIFGMTIVDKEIPEVMAPPGIGEKDQQEQYDLIPDILSAPGMLANPRSIGNSDGDNARDFLMRMDNPSAPERVVARVNTYTNRP